MVNTLYRAQFRSAVQDRPSAPVRPAVRARPIVREQPRLRDPQVVTPASVREAQTVRVRRIPLAARLATARLGLFGGAFAVSYCLIAVAGSASLEGARQQLRSAHSRAASATNYVADVTNSIQALTSAESIDAWAASQRMVDGRAFGDTSAKPHGVRNSQGVKESRSNGPVESIEESPVNGIVARK